MVVTRNPNLGPSQMRARRRRLFLIRFYIILFFLLVIILGLAIFSGHKNITVQTIIVSGNAAVQSDEVLKIANRDMAGRYWYLFAKNNSLIFPRAQIKKDLLKEIKTIKDVNISWSNWQEIDISIMERRPQAVWCGNDIKLPTDCFFIDKVGYIYSQAPVFSGTMFIKNYGLPATIKNASSTDFLGQYYLSREIYTQIYNLIQILDQKEIKVVAVTYDNFDYKFILESGPEIIFNSKNSFELSFNNLFSAIETKNLDLEKDSGVINYIDLRFDNKIVIGKKDK
jgi:cell division septal protein FtsQ